MFDPKMNLKKIKMNQGRSDDEVSDNEQLIGISIILFIVFLTIYLLFNPQEPIKNKKETRQKMTTMEVKHVS